MRSPKDTALAIEKAVCRILLNSSDENITKVCNRFKVNEAHVRKVAYIDKRGA